MPLLEAARGLLLLSAMHFISLVLQGGTMISRKSPPFGAEPSGMAE
jgi:hypothetical protein